MNATDATPSFTPRDHEVAYEQNVSGLEIVWADRIESFAESAISAALAGNQFGDDLDGLHLQATEIVAARLLDSERWANVKATDISDIAYEAVGRVIDSRSRPTTGEEAS